MEEKIKNNNSGKLLKKVLLLLVFVFLISLCGIAGYIVGKGVVSNAKESIEEENLDINSTLVKRLYHNVSSNVSYKNNLYSVDETEVLAGDLDYTIKFVMALNLFDDGDKKSIRCDKYSPSKYFPDYKSVESLDSTSCGDNYYNRITATYENPAQSIAYTTLIEESTIKDRMEEIFGVNSYERKDLIENVGYWYRYIPEENGYVLLRVPAGGTSGYDLETKLVSAKRKDDTLIIVQDVSFIHDVSKDVSNYEYVYTFKYDSNNMSYYLYKLNKNVK